MHKGKATAVETWCFIDTAFLVAPLLYFIAHATSVIMPLVHTSFGNALKGKGAWVAAIWRTIDVEIVVLEHETDVRQPFAL